MPMLATQIIIIIIFMTIYLVIELSASAVAFTSCRISLNLNDTKVSTHMLTSHPLPVTECPISFPVFFVFPFGKIEENPYEKYT